MHFFYPPPLSFSTLPSSSISLSSILSLFRLHSVLFSYINSTCAQLSLSPHRAFCTFFSFRPIPDFSLLVPTSKSRHNFSFFCTLSSQLLGNFFCHTPLILLVVSGFFDSLPSFLLVCVFVPFTRLYIHPSFFWS
jgi:hypothetical protein